MFFLIQTCSSGGDPVSLYEVPKTGLLEHLYALGIRQQIKITGEDLPAGYAFHTFDDLLGLFNARGSIYLTARLHQSMEVEQCRSRTTTVSDRAPLYEARVGRIILPLMSFDIYRVAFAVNERFSLFNYIDTLMSFRMNIAFPVASSKSTGPPCPMPSCVIEK